MKQINELSEMHIRRKVYDEFTSRPAKCIEVEGNYVEM